VGQRRDCEEVVNTLHMACGLPRSGKTTWAQTLSQHRAFPIVNPDSVRLALHGQAFITLAEPMVWTLAKYMVHALFIAGHHGVILDATNLTKQRRDEWIDSRWQRTITIIDTPSDITKARVKKSGFPMEVYERMSENLVWPRDDEGFLEIRTHIP
jgi:predicted kinase